MVGRSFALIVAVMAVSTLMSACNERSSVAGPDGAGNNPSAVLAALGDCGSILLADGGHDQQLVVSVAGSRISFTHENARFNCCIDSVSLSLVLDGADIVITETDYCAQPCLCMCPRDVEGEISGLDPGTYSLAVCDTTGNVLCTADGVRVD